MVAVVAMSQWVHHIPIVVIGIIMGIIIMVLDIMGHIIPTIIHPGIQTVIMETGNFMEAVSGAAMTGMISGVADSMVVAIINNVDYKVEKFRRRDSQ
jgi:hypothetical protein